MFPRGGPRGYNPYTRCRRGPPLMAEPISLPVTEPDRLRPADKVKTFPTTPGVYLMKDDRGEVIYVGKAKNLRSRASTYFTKEAADDDRTRELVKHIADIDFILCET